MRPLFMGLNNDDRIDDSNERTRKDAEKVEYFFPDDAKVEGRGGAGHK